MTQSARQSDPDAIVVGGGIGGLGAALALARKGVRVLERASAFGEVGAGLQIAPNGTRVLAAYGLLDEARDLGVQPASMIMFDALDASELTRLDLRDLERRYGFPYLVMHRSDLHGLLLRGCARAGVDLVTDSRVDGLAADGTGVVRADGRVERASTVIAADGLHSVARASFVGDAPVNSSYVAYRGAMPIEDVRGDDVHEDAVVVYVGPRCHFVQYALRGGEMFNQVAVFESPRAKAGLPDWGLPDELDEAFEGACEQVRRGIPLMWRDRWWRMFDREPVGGWVFGRVALLGDAAHPPGATSGTWTGRAASGATRCSATATPTTTRSSTGSTARPPWTRAGNRRCSSRSRSRSRRPAVPPSRRRARFPSALTPYSLLT